MNLDDFKSLTKGVTAPPGAPSSDTNLDSFISEMRSRDRSARCRLLWMALILFPGGLIFTVLGLAQQRLGIGMIGVGILLVVAYMTLKGRSFGRIDYTVPAQEFLAVAANRYRFWKVKDAPLVIPLMTILGVGGGLTVWTRALIYLSPRGAFIVLAGYIVFFVALVVFALIVSRKNWQREHGALLTEIHRRQRELSNGEGTEPDCGRMPPVPKS